MTKLKAGTYYIGDPCYFWPNDPNGKTMGWGDFVDLFYRYQGGALQISTDVGFFTMWAENTAYGDGEYTVRDGRTVLGDVGVDAGMIAVIPAEMFDYFKSIEPSRYGDRLDDLYVKVEMPTDFDVEFEGETFYIGGIHIYTG